MSATQVPLRPIAKGSLTKFWIAMIALVLVGAGVAYASAQPLQGITTENGVYVRTIEEGEGDTITLMDGALVSYEGRLEDGRVFDSSDGNPIPMLPAQTVPGFSEALQQMRSGGKYLIRIPSELAYGQNPPPGSILSPGDDLIFDIEIGEVVRGVAMQLQQQQQQGAPSPLPPEAQGAPAPAPGAPPAQ